MPNQPLSPTGKPSENHPTARFWDAMDISFWDGFWFEPALITAAATFRSAAFLARNDDVLLASTMKTGTTWLKSLALSILHAAVPGSVDDLLDADNPHFLVPTVESAVYSTKPLLTDIYDASAARLLHTHLPYSLLPDSVKSSPVKIVYVARNPKDTLVSSWHFFNSILKPYPLTAAVDDFCAGVFQYGPFFDHVAEYWVASRKSPEKILFLKYEEMKQDPVGHVEKIGEFLGKPVGGGEAEEIVERCSLERMKNREVNRNGSILMNVPNRSYFRKGEVGDWKNYLSPEMEEKIDRITRENLHSIGLYL